MIELKITTDTMQQMTDQLQAFQALLNATVEDPKPKQETAKPKAPVAKKEKPITKKQKEIMAEDVCEALAELIKQHGLEKGRAVLESFSAKNVTELDENRYDDVMKAIQEIQ
ncbi:hypothetical protein ACQZV8_13390 [Magnetococcales bacterium HHB-1]